MPRERPGEPDAGAHHTHNQRVARGDYLHRATSAQAERFEATGVGRIDLQIDNLGGGADGQAVKGNGAIARTADRFIDGKRIWHDNTHMRLNLTSSVKHSAAEEDWQDVDHATIRSVSTHQERGAGAIVLPIDPQPGDSLGDRRARPAAHETAKLAIMGGALPVRDRR